MIVYVLVGGMKGTTYVQIIKAVLLLLAAGVMTTWVLGYVGFDLSGLLGQAAAANPKGDQVLAPGLQYLNPLDFVSLSLAAVLGTAGLPHILMRFYTVPTATGGPPFGRVGDLDDRCCSCSRWSLGYGAGALVARHASRRAGGANYAAPLLAYGSAVS